MVYICILIDGVLVGVGKEEPRQAGKPSSNVWMR